MSKEDVVFFVGVITTVAVVFGYLYFILSSGIINNMRSVIDFTTPEEFYGWQDMFRVLFGVVGGVICINKALFMRKVCYENKSDKSKAYNNSDGRSMLFLTIMIVLALVIIVVKFIFLYVRPDTVSVFDWGFVWRTLFLIIFSTIPAVIVLIILSKSDESNKQGGY